jgi:hypothetical protein
MTFTPDALHGAPTKNSRDSPPFSAKQKAPPEPTSVKPEHPYVLDLDRRLSAASRILLRAFKYDCRILGAKTARSRIKPKEISKPVARIEFIVGPDR